MDPEEDTNTCRRSVLKTNVCYEMDEDTTSSTTTTSRRINRRVSFNKHYRVLEFSKHVVPLDNTDVYERDPRVTDTSSDSSAVTQRHCQSMELTDSSSFSRPVSTSCIQPVSDVADNVDSTQRRSVLHRMVDIQSSRVCRVSVSSVDQYQGASSQHGVDDSAGVETVTACSDGMELTQCAAVHIETDNTDDVVCDHEQDQAPSMDITSCIDSTSAVSPSTTQQQAVAVENDNVAVETMPVSRPTGPQADDSGMELTEAVVPGVAAGRSVYQPTVVHNTACQSSEAGVSKSADSSCVMSLTNVASTGDSTDSMSVCLPGAPAEQQCGIDCMSDSMDLTRPAPSVSTSAAAAVVTETCSCSHTLAPNTAAKSSTVSLLDVSRRSTLSSADQQENGDMEASAMEFTQAVTGLEKAYTRDMTNVTGDNTQMREQGEKLTPLDSSLVTTSTVHTDRVITGVTNAEQKPLVTSGITDCGDMLPVSAQSAAQDGRGGGGVNDSAMEITETVKLVVNNVSDELAACEDSVMSETAVMPSLVLSQTEESRDQDDMQSSVCDGMSLTCALPGTTVSVGSASDDGAVVSSSVLASEHNVNTSRNTRAKVLDNFVTENTNTTLPAEKSCDLSSIESVSTVAPADCIPKDTASAVASDQTVPGCLAKDTFPHSVEMTSVMSSTACIPDGCLSECASASCADTGAANVTSIRDKSTVCTADCSSDTLSLSICGDVDVHQDGLCGDISLKLSMSDVEMNLMADMSMTGAAAVVAGEISALEVQAGSVHEQGPHDSAPTDSERSSAVGDAVPDTIPSQHEEDLVSSDVDEAKKGKRQFVRYEPSDSPDYKTLRSDVRRSQYLSAASKTSADQSVTSSRRRHQDRDIFSSPALSSDQESVDQELPEAATTLVFSGDSADTSVASSVRDSLYTNAAGETSSAVSAVDVGHDGPGEENSSRTASSDVEDSRERREFSRCSVPTASARQSTFTITRDSIAAAAAAVDEHSSARGSGSACSPTTDVARNCSSARTKSPVVDPHLADVSFPDGELSDDVFNILSTTASSSVLSCAPVTVSRPVTDSVSLLHHRSSTVRRDCAHDTGKIQHHQLIQAERKYEEAAQLRHERWTDFVTSHGHQLLVWPGMN